MQQKMRDALMNTGALETPKALANRPTFETMLYELDRLADNAFEYARKVDAAYTRITGEQVPDNREEKVRDESIPLSSSVLPQLFRLVSKLRSAGHNLELSTERLLNAVE